MTRILTTASLAVILASCTASSDDVRDMDDSNDSSLVETITNCPAEMVLTLDDYPAETLPETDDFVQWHVENAEREGVQSSESGLQHRVIQDGLENGVIPLPGEGMTANYHGYFPNGEVFDSSYLRNDPMTHVSNGFIKGWNEALAEMKVCEARTLYVPADLAYGNSGNGGRPTGTLVFHMQLLSVNR